MNIWRMIGSRLRTAGDMGLLACQARSGFLGQEYHPDAVIAGARQNHAPTGHFLAEKFVRNLDQNASAVTHQRIRADSAPMIQILQNQQTLLDDRVALQALDMRYKTDTAGVVLVGRVI